MVYGNLGISGGEVVYVKIFRLLQTWQVCIWAIRSKRGERILPFPIRLTAGWGGVDWALYPFFSVSPHARQSFFAWLLFVF
jgi:hypothetical protein